MLLGIKVEYYIVCFVGSIILYAKLLADNKKVLKFIAPLNKKWEDNTLVNVIDSILFCILGALVGTWICQPTNLTQSLSAGLGWTGAISATVNANSEKN